MTAPSRYISAANAVPAGAAAAPTQAGPVAPQIAAVASDVPAASDAVQVPIAETKTAAVQSAGLSCSAEILARARLTV